MRHLRPGSLKHHVPNAFVLSPILLYWAPLLAWMTAIFVLSSMTPAEIETASSPVRGFPMLTKPAVAHVVEFGVMAVLARRLLRRYQVLTAPYLWIAVLFVAIGYGATDELHQSFVPGRDPSWQDVGLDSVGALIGLALGEFWGQTLRRIGLGGWLSCHGIGARHGP